MTVTTQCMRKGCTSTVHPWSILTPHHGSSQDSIDETQHHPRTQAARQPRTSDMGMWMERGGKTDTASQAHGTHRSTNTHTSASISQRHHTSHAASRREGYRRRQIDRRRESGGERCTPAGSRGIAESVGHQPLIYTTHSYASRRPDSLLRHV